MERERGGIMGCYTVPAAAAIIHYVMRKKNPAWLASKEHKWLNLMFVGGAIFGVVDHAWNGELLAFSVSDLLLGVVITLTIIASWGIMLLAEKHATTQKVTE